MKLKDIETTSMDLAQEELECFKKKDQEFWESTRELLKYGVPGYDKQGHWQDFRVKVRPLQMDMIAGVREKMPEGWFKNDSSLKRSIIAVGCKVILRLMGMEKGEWHEILLGLNHMAKKARLEEFRKDMKDLKGNILDCNTMSSQEKVKVVELMTKMEKRFLAL